MSSYMKTDWRVLKNRRTPPLAVPIVDKKGQISTQYVSHVVENPWLDVDYAWKGSRRVGIRTVRLSTQGEEQGFQLLGKMFEAEGWPEGYEAFLQFCKENKNRRAPEYPLDSLPEEIGKLRARVAAPVTFDSLPKRPKPKSSKRSSSSSSNASNTSNTTSA